MIKVRIFFFKKKKKKKKGEGDKKRRVSSPHTCIKTKNKQIDNCKADLLYVLLLDRLCTIAKQLLVRGEDGGMRSTTKRCH